MKIKTINQLVQVQPDEKWLIKDVLLRGGLTALVAAPKTTKSFFSLEIAVSICSKTPALGQFDVAGNGRVLLYAAEDTESILRERLEGFLKARQINSLDGLGILTSDCGLKIDHDRNFDELREQVLEFKPSLLILDCFYSLHSISENDSGSVTAVLSRLRKLREDTGCAILLVHHTSKDSDSKRLGARIRGSSAFHGFFETILGLRKNETGEISLDVEHRAAPSVNGIPICLTTDAGIRYQVKSVSPSQVLFREPVGNQILNCIQSRHIPITLTEISKRLDRDIGEVRNEIFLLIKKGMIRFTPKGYLRNGEIQ